VQTTCPQCSQGIIIDDAKIPDRPFSIRCPRCKNTVRFPGKGGAPIAGAPSPAPEPAVEPETMPPQAAPSQVTAPPMATAVPEEVRAQMMAQIRREISFGDAGGAGRALVFLPDHGQAGTITLTLTRQGFAVDTIEDGEEAARLLEQGAYAALATTKTVAPQGKPPSLYQRLHRLSPDARRRVFVIVVGDEFKSGDGTQAFSALADLVVSSRDLANFDNLLHATLQERQRLYQVFGEARRRLGEHA
jgi:predicted Zn finger-like uncharacterized protein